MIYFDLDGVLRALDTILYSKYRVPKILDWQWKHEGKNIFDIVAEDFSILSEAPTTKYFDLIMSYYRETPINILSCQPDNWRPHTKKWLDKHIKNYNVIFTYSGEQKIKKLKEGDLLVEDYPKFKDYSKILLITYPYNEHLEVERRVNNVKELKNYLDKYQETMLYA